MTSIEKKIRQKCWGKRPWKEAKRKIYRILLLDECTLKDRLAEQTPDQGVKALRNWERNRK